MKQSILVQGVCVDPLGSVSMLQLVTYKTLLTSSCQTLGRVLRVFLQPSDQFQFGSQGHFLLIYPSTVLFIPRIQIRSQINTSALATEPNNFSTKQLLYQPTSLPTNFCTTNFCTSVQPVATLMIGWKERKLTLNIEQERGDQVLQEQKEGNKISQFFPSTLHCVDQQVVCLSFQFLLLFPLFFFLVFLFQHRFFFVVPHAENH